MAGSGLAGSEPLLETNARLGQQTGNALIFFQV
jgi:hypothetical protein